MRSTERQPFTTRSWLFAVWLLASSLCAANLRGQACFTQDFSSGPTLSNYAGSAANHFDGLTTNGPGSDFSWSVASNALLGTKPSGYYGGAITRSTDLPTVGGAIYRFSLNVTAPPSAQALSALSFQVGAGFDTSAATAAVASTHSQFAVNLNADGSYVFRDSTAHVNASKAFTGAQNVFFVVNHTGGGLNYLAPDGTTQSVQNDKWDLWVGVSRQFDEAAATTANLAPTDFKMTWSGGDGSMRFDNFSVTPVPEPNALLGSLVLIAAAGGIRGRRMRRPGRWAHGRSQRRSACSSIGKDAVLVDLKTAGRELR